ncbi:DICT sensory domain-containing protein [Haloarculaceae archaeon H-GB11]|nr:DICT sensory domain-containing protein [Haloarculaceae archaeon H-GB11]
MAGETTSHIREFFDEGRASDRALVVLNRTEPRPLVNLLSEAFDGQDVDVAEREEDDEETDLVALVEGDSVVATSPLQALSDAFLMVNSDLYRTGTRTLDEFDAPAVLTELDDTVFSLRGFPASTKEKLLLILISRYIEKQALDADTGTLRSSFQKLSRLNDEAGTREIYERLGGSSVDVHVYGIGDWTPSDAPYAIHTGRKTSTGTRGSSSTILAESRRHTQHSSPTRRSRTCGRGCGRIARRWSTGSTGTWRRRCS